MHDRQLRRGDLVQVRSAGEILRTLDDNASVADLPFMPEMVAHCGRRFVVSARTDKLCDTINSNLQSRRMADCVLLEDLRCDGSAHGGCQAECRMYWSAQWLKRADENAPADPPADDAAVEALRTLAERSARRNGEHPGAYRCQATEMVAASTPLSTADPRPYFRELMSGNVTPGRFVRVMSRATVMQPLQQAGLLKTIPLKGPSSTSPPSEPLGLQPGEWVRVKTPQEIEKTLTDKGMNRGLWFDREMMAFCGQVFQVKKRVSRIVDERTGEMIEFGTDCIMLDGVVCTAERSVGRWFCPREIYSYWRECWLERADPPPSGSTPG